MEIDFVHEGPVVYERLRWYNPELKIHEEKYIKIRTCNTATEAKAVANYYKVREE